jgi:hypothetical protein
MKRSFEDSLWSLTESLTHTALLIIHRRHAPRFRPQVSKLVSRTNSINVNAQCAIKKGLHRRQGQGPAPCAVNIERDLRAPIFNFDWWSICS